MKTYLNNIAFVLSILLFSFNTSFSQSLEFVQQPQSSYTENLDSAWDIYITAKIKNASSQDLNIKVKTQVLSITYGHAYDVCWNDNCSPSTTNNWENSTVYTLPAGAETPSSLFFSHYYSYDLAGNPIDGSGAIKYIFYVVENPQDSLSFEVSYHFTKSSVFESISNSKLKVNFLDNKILRVFAYDNTQMQYNIAIYSLMGAKIAEETFNDYYEKDFSNFGNQVFLYQITQNGKIISSGKIE